jgi:hypothetical protein
VLGDDVHRDFENEIFSAGFCHHPGDFDHIHVPPFDFALMKSMNFLQVMVSEYPRAEPSAEAVNE